ncbi:MAG: AbrB/MazE/SpoVT family DNA-binding domain-containing protein [Actinobacteria bacterium]|nr:AbrB/MazE/SpoVT family DNA-binding domain-containing protein [Actinomycetota bacterium]MDA2999832.1 AbrB/MazE/SpoVT family DNA-binding domain-containing protein [Actinomycetota bacterium]
MVKKIENTGHVQIPMEFLKQLGLSPGDEVVVSLSENGVMIQSVYATQSLRGMFAGSGMLEMLIEDRTTTSR